MIVNFTTKFLALNNVLYYYPNKPRFSIRRARSNRLFFIEGRAKMKQKNLGGRG